MSWFLIPVATHAAKLNTTHAYTITHHTPLPLYWEMRWGVTDMGVADILRAEAKKSSFRTCPGLS